MRNSHLCSLVHGHAELAADGAAAAVLVGLPDLVAGLVVLLGLFPQLLMAHDLVVRYEPVQIIHGPALAALFRSVVLVLHQLAEPSELNSQAPFVLGRHRDGRFFEDVDLGYWL